MVAARALGAAAAAFPKLGPPPEAPQGPLSVAIQRAGAQRWITLEFLLDRHLRQPMRQLEPALRGVLLAAAAQIVCFDRMPVHAIVDESVELARVLVRPGATKLVNAVLRRVAGDVSARRVDERWSPGRDRLPLDDGMVLLNGAVLPDVADLAGHLAIATSCPRKLVRRWLEAFGDEVVIEICRHGVTTPPTIVAVEDDLAAPAVEDGLFRRHELAGYVLWAGSHEQLRRFLAGHRQRRVQDPGSAQPIEATAGLRPRRIIDYCAGRGTKTRQVATLHPQAEVFATDIDAARRAQLTTAMATLSNVTVLPPSEVHAQAGGADLLILDVPCTNTAALGRRPEARYRFTQRQVDSLVGLQRRIIARALLLVRPGGWVLYCTCSLEPQENQQQAAWLVHQNDAALESEQLFLPKGGDTGYYDGSYRALIRLPERPGPNR